jgi:acetyl-CoA carboxylase biotin carboxyl carrier protein
MDFDQLKQILELVREHELTEFEVEQDGLRLKVKKEALYAPVAMHGAAAVPAVSVAPVAASGGSQPSTPVVVGTEVDVELAVVKSPIVGTFYRSSEPGAAPFVDVGTTVRKGQVLCIIEAMKLMNEIDCEYDGDIVHVYVENGQPVQYGERLFAIRTK